MSTPSHPLAPFVEDLLATHGFATVEDLALRLMGEVGLQPEGAYTLYRGVATDILLRMARHGIVKRVNNRYVRDE